MLWRMQNIISCPVALCVMTRQILLQVLEETSEAEVVDVSTEKHQLWVDVLGHTVVGGHGAANNGWHHQGGGTVAQTLPMAFYQGTKSTILCQCKDIAFVFNTGHTVHILVTGRKDFILTMNTWVASPLCVFWTVVPKQTHHQLS